jgi:hypothetical protein
MLPAGKYIISAISMVNCAKCGSRQIIIIRIEYPQLLLDVRDNLVLRDPTVKLGVEHINTAQALIDFYVSGFWSLQKNYWTEKITNCCLD